MAHFLKTAIKQRGRQKQVHSDFQNAGSKTDMEPFQISRLVYFDSDFLGQADHNNNGRF